MSQKELRTLITVLVALALAYGAVRLISERQPEAGAGAEELASLLDGVDPEATTFVRIVGPETSHELRREADGWTVDGYAADSAAVARLWRAVGETDVRGLIAANPANHERLGVSEDSAWAVTFVSSSDHESTVLIGKTGLGFRSAYARAPGADEVLAIEGDLRGAVTRALSDWRDKTIAGVDTAAVHAVVIARDGATVRVDRSADGWRVGEAAADSATVRNLLSELAGLRATGFAEEGEFLAEGGRRTLVALAEAGDTLAELVAAPADGQFRIQAAGGGTVFEIPSWRIDRLTPRRDDLVGG